LNTCDMQFGMNTRHEMFGKVIRGLVTMCSVITGEHWPDPREFITWFVEYWKGWIKWSCYCNI